MSERLIAAGKLLGYSVILAYGGAEIGAEAGEAGVAAEATGVGEAVEAEATVDPNKLNHIFGKAEHNLEAVINEFGSEQNAFKAIQQATQSAVRDQGLKGVFETTVKVGSETITVRGNIIDGIAKIGTAYKP
jgi:hypothetical protein